MNRHFLRFPLSILLALLLFACARGGGETGTGQDEPQVTENHAVTVGVITGFGSVFVNGIEYETGQSSFSVDGTVGDESSLKLGMVVALTGEVNTDGSTGAALKIEFEDNVEGLVTSNTVASNNQLVVMGQNIVVDVDTVFESAESTITSLKMVDVGHIVEVSGYTSGDGTIYATRIELKKLAIDTGDELNVKGIVANLTDTQFSIGNLSIAYTNDVLKDFDDQSLQNGMFVKVESTDGIVNQLFQASEVKLKEANQELEIATESKKVEVEGVITADLLDFEFGLNTYTVLISNSTVYENGDAGGLIAGQKVKVEGNINETGKLVALEIDIKKQSTAELEGLITAIDPTAKTIVVSGQTVQITSTTRVKDEASGSTDDEKRFFHFSDLQVNDYVDLAVYWDEASGKFIATKLERDDYELGSSSGDDEHQLEIQDVITSIDLQTNIVVISGISVDISGLTGFDAKVGDKVDFEGNWVDEKWVATHFEIKDSDDSSDSKPEDD